MFCGGGGEAGMEMGYEAVGPGMLAMVILMVCTGDEGGSRRIWSAPDN